MFRRILIFSILSVFYFLDSNSVSAAELTLKNNFEVIGKDDTFEVYLVLNTENEAINALESTISYSANMKLESISDGNSVISLWIRKPTNENSKNGSVFLSGLIPGGLTIKDGTVLTFTFRNLSEGRGYILVKDAKVLRNDPEASEAKISFKNLEFNIGSAKTVAQAGEKLILDFLPPDEFKIYPARDKDTFDSSWFISFNAQDKGSGINHYEIKEVFLGIWGSWKEGDSPYILSDQLLLSIIKVKALDNVGWEREALFVPFRLYLLYVGLVILLVVLLIRIKKLIKKA